ncbi:MAG: 2-oxopent-4-enoate hydratase [Sphingomonadaceae bacterium]|nr:2-oxopent-4-enoate hydratase [Sphingomonadaceae bacterium]
MTKAEKYGQELYEAMRDRRTVPPLMGRDPSLTIDDAYAISLDFLARRRRDGEKVVGKKIGVTSKAVQDMLGVHQPDFGFLTDWMFVEGDIDVDAKALIAPRAEAEIAFILKDNLVGPGVTAEQVIAATAAIAPCFEIVDSRIQDWQIGIVDTVSDNASCGVYVLGAERLDPRALDLPNPNTLGAYGVTLDAGDVILSGSLVPLAPAVKGDRFDMILSDASGPIGSCTANFV